MPLRPCPPPPPPPHRSRAAAAYSMALGATLGLELTGLPRSARRGWGPAQHALRPARLRARLGGGGQGGAAGKGPQPSPELT